MAKYSQSSKDKLRTCDERLQLVFTEVIKSFDNTIICGERNEADQNTAYNEGRSKVMYPDGKHNQKPSKAIDAAPYPINWVDRDRLHYFAGFVLGTASRMGVRLRWGGDWDMDTQTQDNTFDDLVHFELIED